jgi:hypothetical protein
VGLEGDMAQLKFSNVKGERDLWQEYAEETDDRGKQEVALLAVDVLDQVAEEVERQRSAR